MTVDWHYPFPALLEGKLLKRYKRFFADIELTSGDQITAHCPNTGPMTGVCHIGGRVMVSYAPSPKRKLAYTWELAEVKEPLPTWVGVNTALPNRVIRAALTAHLFPELAPYESVQSEVPYGADRKSRVDFLLTGAATSIYVEVKNTTWAREQVALFPDTVTTRGQKHLRELTALLPTARAVMLYFINRGDCDTFAPGEQADPEYAELLHRGLEKGLEVLPCRFQVTPEGVHYLGQAQLML
jgi:sugar fermentation stimulation protein A